MKTDAPQNGFCAPPSAKRSKTDRSSDLDEVDENIPAIERIQEELHELDELCAKEQMLIQRKFDEKKKPLFEKRQFYIEKIPNFWADALAHHPALTSFCAEDRPILEHLKRIELEDNLDENGSYRIRFIFDNGVKEFFTPTTLEKYVMFDDNQEERVECTEIKWEEGKEPARTLRNNKGEDDEDEDEREVSDEWSVFEWFVKSVPENKPDLGEVIRRELWHAPLGYYMRDQTYDEIDDEDEDDDLDEDVEEDDEEGVEDDGAEDLEDDDDDEGSAEDAE